MNAIAGAKAPERFSNVFLEGLGFKSTNDRLFVGVLKGLGFLGTNGEPTENYYKLMDQTISRQVLASAIETAYDELFSLNRKAYEMPLEEVKGKLKTLTNGSYTDKVYSLMANTFKALCDAADFSKPLEPSPDLKEATPKQTPDVQKTASEYVPEARKTKSYRIDGFTYTIYLKLPDTRDQAVYDALFRSLKEHLLDDNDI